MLNKWKERYKKQGRQEMLLEVMDKFQELHDDYYSQGDEKAQDLVVDLVAYIQEDYEAIGEGYEKSKSNSK